VVQAAVNRNSTGERGDKGLGRRNAQLGSAAIGITTWQAAANGLSVC
jgi:hypothetical protein